MVWTTLVVALGAPVFPASDATPRSAAVVASVQDAVVRAIQARMGQEVVVEVTELDAPWAVLAHASSLVAQPDPSARLATRARVALRWRSASARASGSAQASCVIRVTAAHVRTLRPIPRGSVIGRSDVREVNGDVGAVAIRRVPRDVVGARALRDLAEGEVLTAAAVSARPAVRSGDQVAVRVSSPGVLVEGRGVASQDGNPGQLIRIITVPGRRALQARVVAHGEVEVTHGS